MFSENFVRIITDKIEAVNALEGRIFNGNTISALFYETERFEQGLYE
jgi:splicing factor 45